VYLLKSPSYSEAWYGHCLAGMRWLVKHGFLDEGLLISLERRVNEGIPSTLHVIHTSSEHEWNLWRTPKM
jgi:hypothetical protein